MSPESLSFQATLEEYDWIGYSYRDALPQKVYVTNVGGAPLDISAVKIVKSAGGLAKEANGFVEGSSEAGLKRQLSETCAGATLAPGADCYVTVMYGNPGGVPESDRRARDR